MSAQIPILEELLLIHEEWVNTNEKSDMSGLVIPIKTLESRYHNVIHVLISSKGFHQNLKSKFHLLKAEVEEKYGKNPNAGIIKRQASSLARRESKLKMTRNQFQEMGSNSRPNSGSIPRPNSAVDLEATPDLPQKGQMTLPRIKKPKQFEKIVNRNDDNTGSKNGTLKRERSKRLSGCIGRVANVINKIMFSKYG